MSDILTAAEVQAGIAGRPPEPFRTGRLLELVMDTGRLVRGVVLSDCNVEQVWNATAIVKR